MLEIPISSQSQKILPWIVAIAFFMQTLDNTILNIALPVMAEDLNVNPLQMQSAIIAYILTVALIIPLCGWVCDRFGTQRIFLSAVALFSLGSILCAASHTLSFLIIGRVIQGLGGALMMPVGRLVILRVYPRHDFVKVLSLVTVPGALGPLLGPTLGGWLVEYASWHWIFLINVPMGVVGCIVAYKYMPNLQQSNYHPLDLLGFILFSAAMVLITMGLEGLSELHLPKMSVIILFAVGIICFVYYWKRALKIDYPLFSPALFKIRSFSIGIAGNLFARLGSGSLPFLVPLLLQLALGYSPSKAGMMMVPMAAGSLFTKPIVRFIINYWGYRKLLTVNTFLLGVLICSFSFVTKEMPFIILLLLLGLLGIINSLQFTAMNTVTLIQLSDEQASSGNGFLAVMVQLSISFGIAIAAILLSLFNGGEPSKTIDALPAFQLTFLCIGCFSILASSIFFQLPEKIVMPDK